VDSEVEHLASSLRICPLHRPAEPRGRDRIGRTAIEDLNHAPQRATFPSLKDGLLKLGGHPGRAPGQLPRLIA
jgi:hypothetical protein